jgi:GT2 family glycosyltransferase
VSPGARPRPERPELSVLMVTLNAWDWTQRALAALVEHTEPCFEVIVADNASTDGTLAGLERLERLGELTLLRNPVNRGFGPAVNQAALLARAPHLLLLNTDALVRPGWLSPLRAVLDAEPEVAAVAPRLLHLDGSVQEAGSIVWGDGDVWPYGADQPADRYEYRFRRDVDYASAACMLLRRSAFVDVGGFDPVYAPAYYEDVDLCLALWERGLRVVCQPSSEVTHAGGASTDRARIGTLLQRNRPVFERRWGRVLAARPAAPVHWEPRDVIPGRDLRCDERILVVGDFVPDTRQPRLRDLVLGLARLWPRARITCLALDPDGAESSAPPLLAAGVEIAIPGDDLDAWLSDRRHHYGVVLATSYAAVMPPVRGGLATYQPRAHRVLLLDEAFDHDAGDATYRAGVESAHLLLCRDGAQRERAAGIAPRAALAVVEAARGGSMDAALVAALAAVALAPPAGQDPQSRVSPAGREIVAAASGAARLR